MQEINNTQYFKVQKDQVIEVKDVIARVYEALTEKGYNPVNQIGRLCHEWRSDIYHKPQGCQKSYQACRER